MGLFSRKKKEPKAPAPTVVSAPAQKSLLDEPAIAPATKPAPKSVVAKTPPASQKSSVRYRAPSRKKQISPALPPAQDRFTIYGKILGLMALSTEFRLRPLGQIDALVKPAMNAGQVLIAESQGDGQQPIAIVLWAHVSSEVDQRLSADASAPWRLTPEEWRSGDIPWLILAIGEGRAVSETIKALCVSRLNGKPIKMHGRDKNGKTTVTNYQVQLSR